MTCDESQLPFGLLTDLDALKQGFTIIRREGSQLPFGLLTDLDGMGGNAREEPVQRVSIAFRLTDGFGRDHVAHHTLHNVKVSIAFRLTDGFGRVLLAKH